LRKIYKYYKPNCPPCYALSRLINTTIFSDVVEIIALNADEEVNKKKLEEMGIHEVPVLMKEDGSYITGMQSRSSLLDFVNKGAAA